MARPKKENQELKYYENKQSDFDKSQKEWEEKHGKENAVFTDEQREAIYQLLNPAENTKNNYQRAVYILRIVEILTDWSAFKDVKTITPKNDI